MAVATNAQPLTGGNWVLLGAGPFRVEARPYPIWLWWGDAAPTQGQPGILIDAGQKEDIWTTTQVYASTPVPSAAIIFAPIVSANSSSPISAMDFSVATNSSLLAAIAA
ncbi:hypothetical protein RZS28_09365 [Methylocapsa polymorpha]|uniref:Uncharacterized protein n=1 Tax=Methylocapsa polymorpha TaxID=3080828 RepID=A0ABZ0HQ59_9HYPH|nr:hypothetical protein RZS28_09365 [Methylocapsa sp. RX1]